MSFINIPGAGSGSWKAPVDDFASLPLTGNKPGDTRVTLDSGSIYTWDGSSWLFQTSSSGGVNSVSSNGSITVTGTASDPIIDITYPLQPPSATANTVAGFDSSGALESIPGFEIDTTTGGLYEHLVLQPDDNGGGTVNHLNIDFDPLQDSPNDNYNVSTVQANFDVNSSGFTQGTNGNSVNLLNLYVNHEGTGDIGTPTMVNSYMNIGNGTDPITVRGLFLHSGFADINSGVTVEQNIQGYNFQPHFHTGAIIQDQILAYADFTLVEDEANGYQSFISNPQIGSIANNRNFTGVSTNPSIDSFTGNAGFTGVGLFGNLGTFDTGGYQGVVVNPNIAEISNGFLGINITPNIALNEGNATGINVSMSNVTNAPGVKASLVVQDITYERNQAGTDGNNISVQYLNTTTAGNEVATLVGGSQIQVTIESGVSTATQVAAALAVNFTISSNITVTISGVGSNPQVTYAQTNLAGGVNPGTKKAADFNGDVSINGALSFTGALSIGQLTSFAAQNITSGLGVSSIDSLITAPNIAASATITGTDLLAINTAMLLTIGDNASVTSNFLGYAALGLPAVLSMGTGASIDLVEGAVFALSLDTGATGGTVGEVNLCRALSIPNGVTTVTKLVGYEFDLPFGDVGTNIYGLYMKPASAHNYLAGDLIVGTSDLPSNSSVGIELNSTTKAILNARMTTTQRDALTALDGMQVYNTTTNKLQVRAAGAWVDLH